MSTQRRTTSVGWVLIALQFATHGFAADSPSEKPIAAKDAIHAAAPILAGPLVAALQEGKYANAETALERLSKESKEPNERIYYAYVRGIAQRLGGKGDAARTTLTEALKANPHGPWAAKLRFELATVELAAGHVSAAEELARGEAETLLAGDRKDRLAAVYQTFARKLIKPDDAVTPPDPNGAYELLSQARGLAKGETLRAQLLFAMGQASQDAGNAGRAMQDFQNYLNEYPKGADRTLARYHLGEVQWHSGQPLQGRLTLTDLARDLGQAKAPLSAQDAAIRAQALYQIAHTFGIPNPPDETALNLGVAALKRFLEAYPDHPWTVKAAYEIGESYLNRGHSEQAIEALTAFLKKDASNDEAKRDFAQLSMTATFQIGQILQAQQKFTEAIAAWKGYLAKFPNGPQSADAQRALLDTQLLIAANHIQHERYAEARTAWQAFVAQNPLDDRVPQVLFQIGESFNTEKQFDQAITAWEPLISKFPQSEPAAHAQFAIASLYENVKGDPAAAVERFKKITVEPWRAQAAQRVAVMEAKALTVITPRTFRTGEKAHLKITTRNLEKLTFTAYKLNAEAYFRKKQMLRSVESLDIGLVQPDGEWTVDVPGYAKYKPIDTEYTLKVDVPGVYVVKVTDEKTLQATTLVLGGDLDAIVKTGREQVLVFAQDMKTGRGRAGARVLFSDGNQVILDAKTGPDGVLLRSWEKPRDPSSALHFLVIDGPEVAGSGLGVPEQVAQGITPRAYIYTDRPVYRPGQQVSLRGIVREVQEGQYANLPQAVYRLEVTDSRGRQIVARPVILTAFGTFRESLPLDSGAPVGTYRVRVYQPGKSDFSGNFEVQSYQLKKIDLAFDLKKTVFFRGETIATDLVAKYQYGAPVANRPVAVQVPDGRTLHGTTSAEGRFHVEFSTEGFAEEQGLRLVAQLPQDNVATRAAVLLAIRAFNISLQTSRNVYLDGESFQLTATTEDAQGEPTGESLNVSVLKQVTHAGLVTEREVLHKPLNTDAKTGKGTISLKVDDDQGGTYVVRVAGTDRFGNPIFTDRALTISGKTDVTKLRLLADRQSYKVGEEASINVHSRGHAGTALLTWEADRILSYKLVNLKEGDNPLPWLVDGPQFPNFTLTASRMAGTHFDEARLDVRVERDLRVELKPVKPTVAPGEDVEVEVTTRDQLDRPVAAEISVALVDQSLLRLYRDKLPPIGAFFYNQTRVGAFASQATNTFRYSPDTAVVSDAVVEEAERANAVAANHALKIEVLEKELASLRGRLQVGRGAAGDIADLEVRLEDARRDVGGPLEKRNGIRRPSGGASYWRMQLPRVAKPRTSGVESSSGASAPVARPPMAFFVGGNVIAENGKTLGDQTHEPADAVRFRLSGIADINAPANSRFADPDGEFLDIDEVDGKKQEAGKDIDERLRRFDDLATDEKAGKGLPKNFAELKEKRAVAAQARQRFVETAYWNPSVTTDREGKARITFRAPIALSMYLFTARGVSPNDTLVGQTSASLVVKKDFFVDLKTPSSLTQGDRPRFVAQVHHLGVTGACTLRLTVYAGGHEQVFPKTIDIKRDGVDEVIFEPIEIPDGDSLRLTLTANVGDAHDQLVSEIPIRPWGVQALASASGTTSDDTTVFVGLPAGRAYESPEMLVVVSPTLRRLLIELALGRDAYPLLARATPNCLPVLPSTTVDRASDLLAAAAALGYLRSTRGAAAPEAGRLTDRIQGLVTELVALQNEDGGWSWTSGGVPTGQAAQPSDRTTSARVAWALGAAEPLGLLTDKGVLDKSATYLTQEFAKASGAETETRAMLLHALSTLGRATFEQANSLNRLRQSLPDSALAYLALTFANLDRTPMANEVLDVLGPRAKTEIPAPGRSPRRYWPGANPSPAHRGPTEATALATLAFARIRPRGPEVAQAAEWLLAHREGEGWQPAKAKGPALSALAAFYGRAQGAEDRYNLVVTVNDVEVLKTQVAGSTEGQAVLVPRKAINARDTNRVRFHIEGRGTFGYAVTLTGFTRDFAADQNFVNRTAFINRRVYQPAEPELDGKILPTGFGVAVNPTGFENKATQVALGAKARVALTASRNIPGNQPEWEREFLVVEEHLPAGTALIEGSVQSQASSFSLADGVLTFYFTPNQWPGEISYEVYGFVPGQYRALPASIRSAYEPGKVHLSPVGELRVLSPGEPNTDPYKPTPDELYARGKAHFDAGRLADAADPLESLFSAYTLRDDVAKDAARMLLFINIKEYNPRKTVQYFEVVKEKAPELILTFDQLLVIGKAYRDINEFERAYLVWRGVAEASYLEDARVGEVLRQRGKTLEGIAYLIELWREYPNTASIESDFFGLSQVLAQQAGKAFTDPAIRRELGAAGVTRSELLLQSIRLIQVFLSQSPRNPLADEASLTLVGAFLELEDYKAVVTLAARFATLYPRSTFVDSFQYSEALGEFHLGHHDRAVAVAEAIAKVLYKDANGVEQPSPNKWQALYILGQIYDARRQPDMALKYYEQVAERFTDAAGAIKAFTRKDLKLPEISVIRPDAKEAVARGVGLRAVAPEGPDAKPEVKLDYRNIAEADVKVYPVDLMRLYLTRRNLDQIAGIDLAGITPLFESTIKLGNGEDFASKIRSLPLPLKKEGAYLVMVRGDNLYTSGIVLVSPLELEVLEEPASGRVRVTVRDAHTKDFVPKVQVKVIGRENTGFLSGETDLRGVFVAEGVRGEVTAVARKDAVAYAFYRGTSFVGTPANAKTPPPQDAAPQGGDQQQALDANLRILHGSNQERQIERLQKRYEQGRQGGAAVEGFRGTSPPR